MRRRLCLVGQNVMRRRLLLVGKHCRSRELTVASTALPAAASPWQVEEGTCLVSQLRRAAYRNSHFSLSRGAVSSPAAAVSLPRHDGFSFNSATWCGGSIISCLPRSVGDGAGHRRFLCSASASRGQETEEDRLRLDKEAREGMEEYMVRIEELADQGNVRAQKTAWKWGVRKKVWNYLEDNNLADFPRPVHHRIPNFKGSADAGRRLSRLPEFEAARVVKVNPDTPQKSVRVAALEAQKTLYVPQPRLRTGFFSRIVPGKIPPNKFNFAATAGGMKEVAEALDLTDRTKIDIVVVGSSAVNPVNGARVGKGEGFAELEYGMLRQLGMIDETTPVITSVHDSQVIEENMPPKGKDLMKHDVPVDIIVTPTRVIRVDPSKRFPKPTGIYWDLLSKEKISQIKVLRTLKSLLEKETGTILKLAEQEEALPPLAKRGKIASNSPPPGSTSRSRNLGQSAAPESGSGERAIGTSVSSAAGSAEPPKPQGIRGKLKRS